MSEESDNIPDPKPVPDEHHYKANLAYKRPNQLDAKSMANIIITLSHSPRWKGVFAYDQFSGQILMHRCPPYMDDDKFTVHRLTHVDIVDTTAALEYDGLETSVAKVTDAIKSAASRNTIHPAREYLESLVWDGDARLDRMLIDYFKAREQDVDYLAAVATKWMVAGVKRIMQPGCKFDHMLVLEGAQGLMKSTGLRVLATFGRDKEIEYFTDGVRFENITHPSSIMTMQGKIIIEFAELSGMSRKEVEDIKNWITIQVDELQLKYENPVTPYPRQFILAGTTNDDAWLRDPSGNRRFLPVKCCDYIDIEGLRRDREQLWAEAVVMYKEGFDIHFDHNSKASKVAQQEQEKRLFDDVWTDSVLAFVDKLYEVTTAEIMTVLQIDTGRRDDVATRRIGRILRTAGWTRGHGWVRGGGRARRVWRNPDSSIEPKTSDLWADGDFKQQQQMEEEDGK